MFGLPSLPADNLYKFIAFSGIALVVASAALFVQVEIATEQEYFKARDASRARVDEYKRDKGNIPEDDPGLQRLKSQELLQLVSYHKYLGNRSTVASVLLVPLALFGLAVFLFGLWCWSTKVQRIQDRILRSQDTQERIKEAKEKLELFKLLEGSKDLPDDLRAFIASAIRPDKDSAKPSLSGVPCSQHASAPDQSSTVGTIDNKVEQDSH